MEVMLYNRDLASPTLDEVITTKIQGLRFSTKLHGGFHICSFRMKADLPEAWEWLTKKVFYRLVITDGSKVLWEGRIEDLELTGGHAGATAYGYYANLSDVPYATGYDDNADVVIKDILDAGNCAQISNDQSHIAATGGPAITSGADASYLDIYPNEIVEKLTAFSDDTNKAKWYFAIWEDRIPYLFARSVSSVDWLVGLRDLARFKLKHRGGDLWNSCYAVYEDGGIARTATTTDTDSIAKYGLTRSYVVPQLGTVVIGAAQSYRDGWLKDHKDIWPKLEDIVIGGTVYDTNGVAYPSSWVRAGEVIRIKDLVPASVDAGAVARDALRTFYIVETDYNVDSNQLKIVPDTESTNLDAILAKKL